MLSSFGIEGMCYYGNLQAPFRVDSPEAAAKLISRSEICKFLISFFTFDRY